MIKIRRYKEKDLKECIEIISKTLGKNNGKKAKKDFIKGMHPKLKEYTHLTRIVATKDKKIVGIAGVYTLITHPEKFIGICWYGVMPRYQEKGIGAKLMLKMEEMAKGSNKEIFFVWADKKAVPFYRNFGFKINNRIKLKPAESKILMLKNLRRRNEKQNIS